MLKYMLDTNIVIYTMKNKPASGEEHIMSDKPLDSIRRGLEQALAYAQGTADENEYGAHIPAEIDVKRSAPDSA